MSLFRINKPPAGMYSIKRTCMFIEIHRTLVTDYTNSKSPGSNCIPVNITKDTSKQCLSKLLCQDAVGIATRCWPESSVYLQILDLRAIEVDSLDLSLVLKRAACPGNPGYCKCNHCLMLQHTRLCVWGWSRLRNWVSEHSLHANCTHCAWLSLWETECWWRVSDSKIFIQ